MGSKAQEEYYRHEYEEGEGKRIWDPTIVQPRASSKPCKVCGYAKGDPVHWTKLT